ncbi:MAG: S-layer homology domain-containing protein [Thermodesulfobacteriota bacterium]
MKNRIALLLCLALVCGALGFAGCGKPRAPRAALDTPDHHVANGYKLLTSGKVADAEREFTLAVELDKKYSPAYGGLALASATEGNFEKAGDLLKKADKYAKTPEQEAEACVTYIRFYTLAQKAVSDNWLAKAEQKFSQAKKLLPNDPAAYFYMGMAYRADYDLPQAETMFSKVIDLNGKFVGEADRAYADVQKIERAKPGTPIGRKIALVDKITRGDVAALFIQELGLDKLFAAKKKFDPSFKSPDQIFTTETVVKAPEATDISDHVLKTDIEAVIKSDIRGLTPYPDHTFQPDKPITRAEFAMMLEDILIKATGDEALATRFIDSPSPFPDVRSDVSYFNSVMVCTSRNLMAAKDLATGEFDPMGPVSGADALLSIRALKTLLKADG